jgi:hypothetical protein
MTRNEREELNQLSLRAFGSSSKWVKLVNKGVLEPMQREREVMVPKANGQLVKKTFVDRKNVVKRYTVDEVKALMLQILTPTAIPTSAVNTTEVDMEATTAQSE